MADFCSAVDISGPSTAALVANSAGNGGTIADDGSLMLDTITVQAPTENAWGPVDGYVATRSAIGTKTGALRIETPQSTSVVGRQEMEDRGVQTLNQALVYTPGINTSFDGQIDNGGEAMRLRGFSVDLYTDGLVNPDGWIEPYGTERIEVLRGPASILYGQASPGGVVGTISKMPTEHTIREIGLETSESGGIQGKFDFSGKVTEDGKLLYRLTALGKDFGAGFVPDDVRLKRLYVAPAVTWRPSADTNLTILAKYQYDPDFLGQMAVWPRVGTLLPSTNGVKFNRDMYLSDPSFDDHSYRRQMQIGYLFEHKISGNITIKQNLRFSKNEMDRTYILGFPEPNSFLTWRNSQRQYEVVDMFAVDNQALARFETGSLSHSAIMGLDFRRTDARSESGSGSAPMLDLANPIYGYSGPIPELTSGTERRLYQTGVYAQDQIKWNNATILAGGRYDWAPSRTWDSYDNHKLTNKTNQQKFTYRVGAVYEFSNGLAPYVSYTTSFQPETGTAGPERGNTPFDPTTGQQFELGVKYQPTWFDGFFTAAFYDLKRQNVVTADPEYAGRSVQYGEVQTKGFELSATANITEELRITAQYSYADNKVTAGYPYPWESVDPVGKAPTGMPIHTAGLWAHYTFLSGVFKGLGIGAGVRYSGESWGDGGNTWKVPGVTLVDAALSYDVGKSVPTLEGLNVAVTIQNLFNKEYINACYSSDGCTFGAGRRVNASLVYRW